MTVVIRCCHCRCFASLLNVYMYLGFNIFADLQIYFLACCLVELFDASCVYATAVSGADGLRQHAVCQSPLLV